MNLEFFKDRTNQVIIGLLILCSVISLWLRLLPMLTMGNTDVLSVVASDDPIYNLRQVEQIIANYPNYAWYDPWTLFPVGSLIYWGSLFPTIIATVCIMVGATTRPEIISVGLVIPPIMGMLMVPVMYGIGRIAGDWKTGLLSAGFIAVISGQFFFRSIYGYMDHHIAEVLFSSIFCLIYMYILYVHKDSEIKLDDFSTFKNLVILSVIAGISFIVGLLAMPTMVLFAMIVGIFTGLQFIIDMIRGKSSEYLLLINTVIFSVVIIGVILFGFKTESIDLSSYSVGHVYAYLGLIGMTGFLYVLSERFKNNLLSYLVSLAGIILASAAVLMIFVPSLYNFFIRSFFSFFGQASITNTVQEAMGWTSAGAWIAFNYGLYLMILGFIFMLYQNIKSEHPYQIFVVVWSLIMLISTQQHVRYEYYLAVNIVLLSAVFIGFVIDRGYVDLKLLAQKIISEGNTEKLPEQKVSKGKKHVQYKNKSVYKNPSPNYLVVLITIATVCLGFMFVLTSFTGNYYSASAGIRMNQEWKSSLEWMSEHTPDPGLNYTQIYDAKTFKYPDTAYGVMSWWDYGHLITYIGKRIPNANPFQQGVVEEAGSSHFFIATDEKVANVVLDNAQTRYIITDIEMDSGKFYAMATWHNSTVNVAPYQQYMYSQVGINDYSPVLFYLDDYYQTMISRLHNFDGSYTEPTNVYYVEYVDPIISGGNAPIISRSKLMNYIDAEKAVNDYNARAQSGHHAIAVNTVVVFPVKPVPALQHYRLVHESPTNVFAQANSSVDVKYVKIFEYVKGARIKGDGFIGVNIRTDAGRQFTYIQQSVNGEFIVPYSNEKVYDTVTISKYQIIGTGKEYYVTENDVMNGLEVK